MQVLHLNTFPNGGAAKACKRLHEALLELDVKSRLFTLHPHKRKIPEGYAFFNKWQSRSHRWRERIELYFDKERRHVKLVLEARPRGLEVFTSPRTSTALFERRELLNADIIHLHWVAGLVDYRSFFPRLRKRLVWTLHDLNPVTGGCHFSGTCTRFQSQCNNCPQLQGTIDPNLAQTFFDEKLVALKDLEAEQVVIVAPSEWIHELSRSSRILGRFRHELIPNGVPTSIYKVRDKQACRKKLGLPLKDPLFLMVCHSAVRDRKGYPLLQEALAHIPRTRELTVCVVGEHFSSRRCPWPIIHRGTVDSEDILATYYSAADALVVPSLDDNLPNTMLEALMCGTPVIGFPIGGIKDAIVSGFNGVLCKETSAMSLADVLSRMPEFRFSPSAICEHARQIFDSKIQAERYKRVYSEVLNA